MKTLKGKRVDKGYTQKEMAERLGLSTKTYNRKELGIAEFSLKETREIANILDLDLNNFNSIFLKNELPNG